MILQPLSMVFPDPFCLQHRLTPSVGPIRASSQGLCGTSGTVVPDTPVASQDVDMDPCPDAGVGEMDRLSRVLSAVQLSSNANLQHHLAEIMRLVRAGG